MTPQQTPQRREWTARDVQFIRNNPTLTNQQLADHFRVSYNQVYKTKQRIRFNETKHLPIV